ncbi:THAP domain-containing protein 11-like [Chanos chanos]|uniref:THAP domain-containing protein 11 n=1 Tax=Chanos chanos TaxID=29144 RepID=A0A6J2UU21_CHACN|nr:THAP domain-containing protein 11-like [Chanos chanos]
MPGFTCCVPGCYNNSQRDKDKRFYIFPKDKTLRETWLKNISRNGVNGCFSTFQPTTGHRVCSAHFVGGRKTYTTRIPTIFPLWGVNEKRRRRRKKPAALLPSITNVNPNVDDVGLHSEAKEGIEDLQDGENGLDVKPILLSAETIENCQTAVVSCAVTDCNTDLQPVVTTTSADKQSAPALDTSLQSLVDHPYSVPSGTTALDMLKKLNEQRDIIASMEATMKELGSTIHHLRVTEAKLLEQIRERDALLSGTFLPKKYPRNLQAMPI